MSSSEHTEPDDDLGIKALILQTVIFTVVVIVAVVFLGTYVREDVETFANWIIDTFGMLGLFVGVFVTDAFTVPVPADTYLLVTVARGQEIVKMLAICCAASVSAGTVAYLIGPYIGQIWLFRKRVEKFRIRGERLFERFGVWTVVIAALTPIPFSIVCWFAGVYKMTYTKFFFASLARVPRLVGYYVLYTLGWA